MMPKGALVTGGARGIGRAICGRLARRGDRVIVADLDGGEAEATARALRQEQLDATAMVLDVTDEASVSSVIADADALAPLGTVVNNAGVAWSQPLTEVSAKRFDALMAVNVRGAFLVLQAAARAMRPRATGVVINLASTSAFTASTVPMVPYDLSKGAVRMLTVAAARELAADGIRVNAVAPGTIDTRMTRGLAIDERALERLAKHRIPLGRIGGPEEIAGAVDYLSSPDAAYVTGHVLVVDGGWLT